MFFFQFLQVANAKEKSQFKPHFPVSPSVIKKNRFQNSKYSNSPAISSSKNSNARKKYFYEVASTEDDWSDTNQVGKYLNERENYFYELPVNDVRKYFNERPSTELNEYEKYFSIQRRSGLEEKDKSSSQIVEKKR